MLSVLRQELVYAGHKQLFATILFIVIAPPVLEALPLGFTSLSANVFRFLCVGYGTYAIANSMMLILLYFEDYTHALIGSSLFAMISTAATIWQVLYGNQNFYGIGFFAGALALFFVSVFGLEYHTKRLPYYLLARQSILPHKQRGPLVFVADKLDERQKRLEAERQKRLAEDKRDASSNTHS